MAIEAEQISRKEDILETLAILRAEKDEFQQEYRRLKEICQRQIDEIVILTKSNITKNKENDHLLNLVENLKISDNVQQPSSHLMTKHTDIDAEPVYLREKVRDLQIEVESLSKGANTVIFNMQSTSAKMLCSILRVVFEYDDHNFPSEEFIANLSSKYGLLVDSEFYKTWYDDIVAVGANPVDHFFRFGIIEGRAPRNLFIDEEIVRSQ